MLYLYCKKPRLGATPGREPERRKEVSGSEDCRRHIDSSLAIAPRESTTRRLQELLFLNQLANASGNSLMGFTEHFFSEVTRNAVRPIGLSQLKDLLFDRSKNVNAGHDTSFRTTMVM
jgi:hypothetical protein